LSSTRVKALTNRKWDGVLSLVWACSGVLIFRFGAFGWASATLAFFLVFGAWWGAAMLLAVSGVRGSSRLGAVTGLCTLLFFH
jgi:hypothetical protein